MCGYCEQGPRWCIGCGDVDLRGKLGLRCEDCRAAWLEGKKARSLADVLRWQHDNPEATMLIRARSRAKRRGVECTITVDDIVIPELCPVTGVELTRNLGELHSSPDSPSIDRIDNTRGYVPGNVHVISQRANGMKRDLSVAELAAGEAGEHWREFAIRLMAA